MKKIALEGNNTSKIGQVYATLFNESFRLQPNTCYIEFNHKMHSAYLRGHRALYDQLQVDIRYKNPPGNSPKIFEGPSVKRR